MSRLIISTGILIVAPRQPAFNSPHTCWHTPLSKLSSFSLLASDVWHPLSPTPTSYIMHVSHLLPFLSLVAGLPHIKQEEKKSLSIAFTQRSIRHTRATPLGGRLSKRQSGSSSGDAQAELLNDNNVRCVKSAEGR